MGWLETMLEILGLGFGTFTYYVSYTVHVACLILPIKKKVTRKGKLLGDGLQ